MIKGKILVISGPSGVGKKTVLDICKNKYNLDLVESVSATTRQPRTGEINGKDYHFMSEENFQEKINNNEFLEHAKFSGNYYGTLKEEVQNIISTGKSVYLEIEVKGALQIMSMKMKETVFLFIKPPSFKELAKRLRERKTENKIEQFKRLKTARKEMKQAHLYDYVVINKEPDDAAKEIISILKNK